MCLFFGSINLSCWQVYHPSDAEDYAWKSAKQFILELRNHDPKMETDFVTKEKYFEYGHEYCNQKFQNAW